MKKDAYIAPVVEVAILGIQDVLTFSGLVDPNQALGDNDLPIIWARTRE